MSNPETNTAPSAPAARRAAAPPGQPPVRFRERPAIAIPAEPRLHFEPGLKYACVQCGFGCRTMEVQLDRPSWEAIDGLPLDAMEPRARQAESAVVASPAGGVCALRQVDGKCLFLEGANLCGLHRVHGYDKKPQPCRDFPFRYTVTPDGVYVGLSFACTAIQTEQGPPVETHAPTIREQIGASLNIHEAAADGGRVALTGDLAISWEQYLRLEALLGELLARKDKPLDVVLRAGYIMLRLLVNFLEEARTAAKQNASVGERHDWSPDTIIDHYLDKMRGEQFALPLRLAHKPLEGATMKRIFLGTLIHFRNAVARRPAARPAAALSLAWQYVKNFLKLGGVEMLPLDGGVPWSALERMRADWDEPFIDYQRRRFLRHQIFRKDLAAHYPVITAWGLLMVQQALVHWYALSMAHRRAAAEVGREDVLEAIRHVETHYSHHFTFTQLFFRMPALWTFIERLLRHDRFPYIITSAP